MGFRLRCKRFLLAEKTEVHEVCYESECLIVGGLVMTIDIG